MSQKAKITAFMTFKIICLVISVFLWVVGFIVFRNCLSNDDITQSVIGWILWGVMTMLAMPVELLKNIIQGAKDGAIEGANTFKIRDNGSTFTVSNSPGSGALKGILINGFVCLAFGPINLALKSFANLMVILQCIVAIKKLNKSSAK